MEMLFLELTVSQATIIAIALPIIALCFAILIIPWMRNGSGGSTLRQYLSYFVNPPRIHSEGDSEKGSEALWRNTKVKLFFYYLAIALFLVSFIIGEFYEVMIDLVLPVTQGNTGEIRAATSMIFQSPFNAGWVGSLPWVGFATYHETWDWIFFTAALTDNPHFLASLVEALILFSIGMGLVFLSPIAIRSIRQSFLPSLFFFMTGMTIFTKAAVGYFAGALKLLYSTIEFEYYPLAVTGDILPNYSGVMTSCILLILPMFALFVVLGRKLWKVHYADSKSRTGFTVYITLCFWIGLLLTMAV